MTNLVDAREIAAMAAASPTSLTSSNNSFYNRPSSLHYAASRPQRPHLKRASPLSTVSAANRAIGQQNSTGDSSDDESSAPALSAEAEAILGMNTSLAPLRTQSQTAEISKGHRTTQGMIAPSGISPSSRPVLLGRDSPPSTIHTGSPRIVSLKVSSATLRRTTSTKNLYPSQSPASVIGSLDTLTPASRPEQVKSIGSRGENISPSGGSDYNGAPNIKPLSEPSTISRDHPDTVQEAAVHVGSLTINKPRVDETGVQGSLRTKRVGKVTGSYLSGPARRGMIRRQSEEDQSPQQEDAAPVGGENHVSLGADLYHNNFDNDKVPRSHQNQDFVIDSNLHHDAHHVRFANRANVLHEDEIQSKIEPLKSSIPQNEPMRYKSTPSSGSSNNSSSKRVQPVFKVPPLPALPSRYDQENEPPPTFKRNKPISHSLLDQPQKLSVMTDEKMLAGTPATISPPRKALALRSQNTPHRPAPPPPKMTVLETATATAGAASASQSKKKRNYISVNGKIFTRMDVLGRGGSGKVWRVMAENFKVFALKRVNMEDADEASIRSFKGEIDLLRKLENVDRVIRLFDWEVNDERQTLSILMEVGEKDLNRLLNLRLGAEDAKFDITFTRFYWKEMLECVQAVHDHDIVHSDLKPANFLLVQGRLKLCDFGIAGAINNDTVNVHREQQVGTPNYMSPESLLDFNAKSGLPSSVGKMMKIGKPSDVWSLGCILYQMVYGKPPFAHIANPMQRIMAIPNANHVIEYPALGLGGALVPTGLVRTLRRCLNRDLTQRPTLAELLVDGDPFLHPDALLAGTVPVGQDLIKRLQDNIVRHIREKGMPSDEDLAMWPGLFYARIKVAVEEGRL